jgi:hypothetical protein
MRAVEEGLPVLRAPPHLGGGVRRTGHGEI